MTETILAPEVPADIDRMGFMVDWLRGKRIQDAYVDSEVIYVMLEDGTQMTVKGLVIVEPNPTSSVRGTETAAHE